MPNWIKIEDRPAPVHECVWVYDVDLKAVRRATFSGYGTWITRYSAKGYVERVTHWQPIVRPEPPQEA